MTSLGLKISLLVIGLVLGAMAGYLVAQARNPDLASSPETSAELAKIHTELAELRAQTALVSVNEQVAQLETIVSDVLLRGDEFLLRADFARNADQLGGHGPSHFALRDADEDGTEDVEQLRHALDNMLSGKTPVSLAKKADSAGDAERFGDLPIADFASADHVHETMTGNVRMLDDLRVDGALAVSGMAASGSVQVFGEVVAVGGLLPGAVDVEPKPAMAGMIRYNRGLGALEYCDGTRWNELAVVE